MSYKLFPFLSSTWICSPELPVNMHMGMALKSGGRPVEASGTPLDVSFDDQDAAKKFEFLSETLRFRAQKTPEHVLFSLLDSKVLDMWDYLYPFKLKIVKHLKCFISRYIVFKGLDEKLVYQPLSVTLRTPNLLPCCDICAAFLALSEVWVAPAVISPYQQCV